MADDFYALLLRRQREMKMKKGDGVVGVGDKEEANGVVEVDDEKVEREKCTALLDEMKAREKREEQVWLQELERSEGGLKRKVSQRRLSFANFNRRTRGICRVVKMGWVFFFSCGGNGRKLGDLGDCGGYCQVYIGMKVGTFCGDVYAEGFWSLSREILVFCFCLNPRPVIIVCQRKARRLVGWSGLVANIKVDCTM